MQAYFISSGKEDPDCRVTEGQRTQQIHGDGQVPCTRHTQDRPCGIGIEHNVWICVPHGWVKHRSGSDLSIQEVDPRNVEIPGNDRA